MTEEEKQTLLTLYPPYTKVLGPYFRPDGRQHIILNDTNKSKGERGKTKTISYPKALMEIRLNRRLNEDETVDHIDKNVLNNSEDNLHILSRSDHTKLDVKRRKPIVKCCSWCGKEFEVRRDQLTNRGRGYFCSKQCSGKYGAELQNGRTKKVSEKDHKIEYYTNKDVNGN